MMNIKIGVNTKELAKLNELLAIDDFECSTEEMDKLGYPVDAIVFSESVISGEYTIWLEVYTGQTNAWAEFCICKGNLVPMFSEPIFEPLDSSEFNVEFDGKEFNVVVVGLA